MSPIALSKWSMVFLIGKLEKSKLQETCQKRKLKALKNKFQTVKILYLFLFHNWPDRFKMNKILQYQSILQNPRSIYSYIQWNYFQRGCIDKRRTGDFPIQTRLYTFRSFASKNFCVLTLRVESTHSYLMVICSFNFTK